MTKNKGILLEVENYLINRFESITEQLEESDLDGDAESREFYLEDWGRLQEIKIIMKKMGVEVPAQT